MLVMLYFVWNKYQTVLEVPTPAQLAAAEAKNQSKSFF